VSSVIYFFVGLLLVVVGAVFSVGAVLPRDHIASRAITLRAPAHEVWMLLADPRGYPSWRSSVKSVEILSKENEPSRWVETSGSDRLKMAVVDSTPEQALVIRIDDDTLPYGGTWRFTLSPSTNTADTRLEITESGFVNPAPFRFLSRFVFGHATTMTRYLADLEQRLKGAGIGR